MKQTSDPHRDHTLKAWWFETIAELGDDRCAAEVFNDLDARYREPQRHYHTWRHIYDSLVLLHTFREEDHVGPEIDLAVWFHDAVYVAANKNNEVESARLLLTKTPMLGFSKRLARRAARLIEDTRIDALYSKASRTLERGHDIMRDIDLSILGDSPGEYERYSKGIYKEYERLDRKVFSERRAALLEQLLERPHIFTYRFFSERFEEQARLNIRGEIESLRRFSSLV